MADHRNVAKVAAGAVATLAVAAAWGVQSDEARAAKSAPGGALSVLSVNVRGRTNVPANEIIEIKFNAAIDVASVSPATIYVRQQNSSLTGFTKQVPGSFNTSGNIVRFFPRLPGHRRDATGAFYTEGSPNDDATLNCGLQSAKNYQLTILGSPAATPVRSTRGRGLRHSSTAKFTTAAASDPGLLYTSRTYSDAPPPQFAFSNPADTVPSAETNYAVRGGTKGVPNDIAIQLYCTRVPLSPVTARAPGNVALTMVERYGNPALRRPAQGSVFVEQNSETTLLVFQPRFPLADQGEYSLRVSKNLKDLTEQSDFLNNRDRERLRQVYEFMSTERANNPGVPPEDLNDPPQSLVGDWPPPTDTEARGVLKANVLKLGDAYPDEIDPRVMVLFSTRDEPISTAKWVLEFRRSENLFDAVLSTGDWDTVSAPDVAQAIFTYAAGSVVDGDFLPKSSQQITPSPTSGATFNYRNVVIPQGVVITVGGNRPVTIKCLSFQLDGTISVDGTKGGDSPQNVGYTSYDFTQAKGGPGGPGGGKGADSAGSSSAGAGASGVPGVDINGFQLPPGEGGQAGAGGSYTTSGVTYASNGGGGGGGGGRLKGEDGANSTNAPSNWTGNSGGTGGAGSANDDLDPFGGGAGAGSGAAGTWPNYTWGANGGAGGGGGGALTVQTSGVLSISTTGQIRARGGQGGTSCFGQYNYWESGPGGGGGGGSVLLRTTRTFNIANPTGAIDVTGGARGKPGSGGPVYGAAFGGAGGAGYVGFQDPFGAATISAAVPASKAGVFNPVGGGVASYVYSRWYDLGNEDPKILPFNEKDPDDPKTKNTKDNIATNATTNDAVYVQIQMTSEDRANFGNPDVSAISGTQDSTNTKISSQWTPVKVHDNTTVGGSGVFNVPGYDKGINGSEYAGFPLDTLNGKGYRFVRYRIYFQLDQTQGYADPLPNVDFSILRYQYNL